MFDAILELSIGIVLVLFIAGFIAGANTASLSSTDILILGFVPTLSLILIVMGSVKMMRKSSNL